ncbi:hypothetical protein [Amycolatopsis sp. 195334CR]|uniref:hypothetical protein n=1 Tax=Amycolatopsis sp. 195334CR TaxID=2814588 RepID=UPI001A8E49CD|nr:hypothetical protein [Amycolatopsis sp. 195334CR]MBN6038598.1 hypothetical protein [Amycolatopsis sp. 195334CR]
MRTRVTEAMERLSAQGLPGPARKDVPRRRVLLTAGAAVLAAAAGTFTFRGTESAPPLLQFSPTAVASDPATLLHELAARARQHGGPPGSGGVLYSERSQWLFVTKLDVHGRDLGSELVERTIQTWLAADGTGREHQNPEDGHGPPAMERPLSAQGLLPGTDQEAALRQEGQGKSAEWWLEATLRWGAQLHVPATAAAYLDVLAEQPGLTVEGHTTDRRGRAAVAVSAHSYQPDRGFPDQRRYLLIAPDTGQLLATELVATTAEGNDVPTTVGYLLWNTTGFVADLHSRP